MLKVLIFLTVLSVKADGLRDTFVKAVVEECNKTDVQAQELATPGRAGNVVKYKLCPQNPVEISDDCKLKCSSSAGNVVGN